MPDEKQVRDWIKGVVFAGPCPPPTFIWHLATETDRDPNAFGKYFGSLQYFAEKYPEYAKYAKPKEEK
jgi:hypothetical protein